MSLTVDDIQRQTMGCLCFSFQLQRGISTMSSASVASSNQLVPEINNDDFNDGSEEDGSFVTKPVVDDEQVWHV